MSGFGKAQKPADSRRRLFRRAAVWGTLLGTFTCAAVGVAGDKGAAFFISSAVGVACGIAGLRLLFGAWAAAPNGTQVGLLYGARLAVVFGSVLAALFLPFADALGVLLPELFYIPALAVLMALEDAAR